MIIAILSLLATIVVLVHFFFHLLHFCELVIVESCISCLYYLIVHSVIYVVVFVIIVIVSESVESSTPPGSAYKHQRVHEHLTVSEMNEPTSYEEAVSGREAEQWKSAIKEELQAMNKSNVWTIVKRTSDMNVIGSKWVFKKKRNEVGEVVRYKARLVAKGYNQQYGID